MNAPLGRRVMAMSDPQCGAIPPNVIGPIPCRLDPGHDGQHFSTTGCAGSEIHWTDSTPPVREAGDEGIAAVLLPVLMAEYGGEPEDWTGMRSLRRVAAALAPLIAERERAAGERALREAADFCEAVAASSMGSVRADYADGWREASSQMLTEMRARAAALAPETPEADK